MNLVVAFFAEIFLLGGGIFGFVMAMIRIQKQENDPNKAIREKPEKIKTKTVAAPKEKPAARRKRDKKGSGTISLSSRIPSKENTWTDINCSFEGTDETACVENNRSREDRAYEILDRKMNRKNKKSS